MYPHSNHFETAKSTPPFGRERVDAYSIDTEKKAQIKHLKDTGKPLL